MKVLFIGGPMHMRAVEFREPPGAEPFCVDGVRYLRAVLTLPGVDRNQRQHVVFCTLDAVVISDYPEVLDYLRGVERN